MQKWRNWQTRTVQVRVVAIPCGFDSHLLQEKKESCFHRKTAFFVDKYDSTGRLSKDGYQKKLRIKLSIKFLLK